VRDAGDVEKDLDLDLDLDHGDGRSFRKEQMHADSVESYIDQRKEKK